MIFKLPYQCIPSSIHRKLGQIGIQKTPEGLYMVVVNFLMFKMGTVISTILPVNNFAPKCVGNGKYNSRILSLRRFINAFLPGFGILNVCSDLSPQGVRDAGWNR